MRNNMKFERAARRRKYFAIFTAILLHAAIFAAISNDKELVELVPDFIKELVQSKDAPLDTTPRP